MPVPSNVPATGVPLSAVTSNPLAPAPPPSTVIETSNAESFGGQDYVLRSSAFTLGRHSGCNLVFDGDHYPNVSTRHCEIVCERRGYVLRDRSRNLIGAEDLALMHIEGNAIQCDDAAELDADVANRKQG